jgi:hypothetical protein
MTTIIIKENTKQSKLLIEYLKTLSFVEISTTRKIDHEIQKVSKEVNKKMSQKLLKMHDIEL